LEVFEPVPRRFCGHDGYDQTVEVNHMIRMLRRRLTRAFGYDHDTVRHLRPMAQDFAAAFGLGDNDRQP